jgi:hypothetical protein
MSWALTILVSAVGAAGSAYLAWLYRERAPAALNYPAKMTEKFAEIVNLPRKPGEKLSDWDARVVAQHKALREASDEFFAAVRCDGEVTAVGERGAHWILPVDHPAAIRYARAKGGLPRA